MNARALRTALLAGRRRPRRIGAGSPTQYRGDGYEFVELREYLPGDDPRRIDWAATARSGDLQTRVVLEDVALTLAMVIDDSASMRVGRRRELRDAAREAAAAWFECALSGDRCLDIRDDTILQGKGNVFAAMARGGSAARASAIDTPAALRVARAALPRGAALLLVTDAFDFSNADDDLLAALAWRYDCTVLLARDPWHDDFPLRGLVRLRDAETGAAKRVYIGAAQAATLERAVRERAAAAEARFSLAGWRVGSLFEGDGAASLYAAFGFTSLLEGIRA